jgi:hypothetical protein
LTGLDGKSVFTGFSIRRKIDPRWLWDEPKVEHFSARIFTDDSIIIGLPGMDYDHYLNVPEFSEEHISESVEKEMDEARNAYHLIPPENRKRWVLLQFPALQGWDGIRLSCKEIFRNPDYTDESKLEVEVFPVKSFHNDTKRTMINWFVQWKVVAHDEGSRVERKRGDLTTNKAWSAAAESASKWDNIYGDHPNQQEMETDADQGSEGGA